MEKTEMYISNNTLNVRVTNIKEFRGLIEKAEKQACDLRETIRKLEMFDLKIDFTTGS